MTLDEIKSQCDVAENGCWHWMGARMRGIPVVQINYKRHRVARMTLLAQGKAIPKNQFVFLTCGDINCVSPEHVELRTRSAYVTEAKKRMSPQPYSKKRDARAATARLNYDKARQIRELRKEGLSLWKIAMRFEVSPSAVHNIVRNRSWREASPWG